MSGEMRVRLTVDEIEPNAGGEMVATLVSDDGQVAVVPLAMLPENTRVNQVIEASFTATVLGEERLGRIRALQHRLFNRGCDP